MNDPRVVEPYNVPRVLIADGRWRESRMPANQGLINHLTLDVISTFYKRRFDELLDLRFLLPQRGAADQVRQETNLAFKSRVDSDENAVALSFGKSAHR